MSLSVHSVAYNLIKLGKRLKKRQLCSLKSSIFATDVTHYREHNKEKSNFFCPVFFHLLLSGNFGDRYFGTDAPSDWCESDEGMEFWGERCRVVTKALSHWKKKTADWCHWCPPEQSAVALQTASHSQWYTLRSVWLLKKSGAKVESVSCPAGCGMLLKRWYTIKL